MPLSRKECCSTVHRLGSESALHWRTRSIFPFLSFSCFDWQKSISSTPSQHRECIQRKVRNVEMEWEWLNEKMGIETQGVDRIHEEEKNRPSILNAFFLLWFLTWQITANETPTKPRKNRKSKERRERQGRKLNCRCKVCRQLYDQVTEFLVHDYARLSSFTNWSDWFYEFERLDSAYIIKNSLLMTCVSCMAWCMFYILSLRYLRYCGSLWTPSPCRDELVQKHPKFAVA